MMFVHLLYIRSGFPFSCSCIHCVHLLKIKNNDECSFYEIEATNSCLSVGEFVSQSNASLLEWLSLSNNRKAIKALAKKELVTEKPTDVLKRDYIPTSIGLGEDETNTMSQL